MEKRLGRYELRRTAGRGAAGTVWEAWDPTLTRPVAVKVVRAGGKDSAEFEEVVTRFRQEAQVASRLSHPGVVQVFDAGEFEGQAYIVMEFIEGETLKAAMDQGDRLPVDRVGAIMRELLRALEHCHRLGVVHRDIKPSNIMLPSDGGVKLADFGIARIENSELTLVGTLMGTPPYMSPEQFTAREPIDFRSDLWSCGVVFYEMLTGTRPFGGTSGTAIGQAVVNDPAEAPSRRVPGLSTVFDPVVARALQKAPADRFPSAQAFEAAIHAALLTASAPPVSAKRRWLPVAGGIGGGVVIAAGVLTWLWTTGHPISVPISVPDPSHAPSQPASFVSPPALVPIPARVAALSCSTVAVRPGHAPGSMELHGIIGSGAPRAELDAIVAQLPQSASSAAVQTFPWSALGCHLAETVRANAGTGETRLSASGGQTELVTGDDIRLSLAMPGFDGEVRLDDFNSDGLVDHLMEANLGTLPKHRARETIGLGPDGELIGHVSPPYGSDILVTIVTSEPLFTTPRALEEPGGTFVDELAAALTSLRQRGGRVAADALVLTTSQR